MNDFGGEAAAGQVVAGRYRLTRKLGGGGFGRVWLARDEEFRVDVAIKQVWVPESASAAEQQERLLRAQREARNTAQLRDHPNVVTVYDVVIDGGAPWTVMQLVRGSSLQEQLDLHGPLPESQAVKVASGVLDALGAAHAAGIVHRDVKPANVLLSENGGVLLTDFGIAVAQADTALTATNTFIGSVEYIAPERARGGDAGPESDLFSLGVTLYQALSGKSPFRRDSTVGSLTAVLFEEPAPLSGSAFADLVMALMAKDPGARPTVAQASVKSSIRRAHMATFDDVMRDKSQQRDNLYGDPTKLGAREDLQRRFGVNPLPIADWELGLVDLSNVQRALDAGCGTGAFLLPLARQITPRGATVIGLDLAEGTLGQARARVQAEGLPVDCLIGDVEALPFDDGSFDLALANYMLYHVPDLDWTLAELRRVVRPGGTLLAATNGQGHMRELWQLQEQALVDAGVSPQRAAEAIERGRAAGALSFRLENGAERLRRHFTDVHLERYPDELHVDEVEPLVAYVASMWCVDQMLEAATATDHERAALRTRVVDSFRVIVRERIAADGVVRISKETGAFVAR